MKNKTIKQIESGRPRGMTSLELIDFCLSALYRDEEHNFEESINRYITFEELLGALLVARDDLAVLKDIGYL
jgi:hypothetical protein